MASSKKKKKQSKSSGSDRKTAVTVKNTNPHSKEIAAIVIFTAALLLFLSFIGHAGTLGGWVRTLFFGVFGAPASYGIIAVALALVICLFGDNADKVFRPRNCVLLVFFILFMSSFIFTCAVKEPCAFTFGDMFERSWNSSVGGICGGMFSLTLQNLIARAATFIVIITGVLITSILLFSISLFRFFKKIGLISASAASKMKRISKRFRQDREKSKKEKEKNSRPDEQEEKDEPAGGYTITTADGYIVDAETGEIKEEPGENDGHVNDFTPELVTGEQIPIEMTEKDESEVPEEKPYVFPPLDMLTAPESSERQIDKDAIQARAQKLEDAMKSFGVAAKVINVAVGPNVIRYELQPQAGVKVSQITSLSNDIALNLATKGSVRIEAPIPGKAAIGIEVPNDERYTVYLREIIESPAFKNHKSPLAVCLGKDVEGTPVVADIQKMPHLLIGGTTGSGKSILLNSIIISLLYKSSPDDVKLILLDPKMVEMSVYNGIPHLLFPVVVDSKKAAGTLSWAVEEMERRYQSFAEAGERELEQYNAYARENGLKKYPSIVIIIDELADLMSVAKDSVETSINRLAAKARAAGIHLIIATQRPSVNVLTGTIKANVPARLSLYVSSFVDSKTILDSAGAEKLLGKGDMLYMPNGKDTMKRIQCAYVDKEIREIVKFLHDNSPAQYDNEAISKIDIHANNIDKKGREIETGAPGSEPGAEDEFLEQAVKVALQYKKISASFLQTKLGIGFQRATRIVQWMEDNGIISGRDGNNAREILIENMDEFYAKINKKES